MLFVALRRVPLITTLSILPFEPSPNLRRVANRSVHDPQMWDLVGDDDVADPEMLAEVVSTAAGRPVISFLGTAFPAKGFGFLAAIISAKPEITQHLCIFVAGAVSEPCRADAAIMSAAGAMVVDRRVSDEELAALYQASDAIWACYHADYDQASGIFGRAVQYGRRAVIRHDAVVIGHYVDILGVKAICLPDDAELAADILLASFNDQRPDGPDLSETLRLWREAFVSEIDRGTGNLISDPKHAA